MAMAIPANTWQHLPEPHFTIPGNTIQHYTYMLYHTIQYNTILYYTIPGNTWQHLPELNYPMPIQNASVSSTEYITLQYLEGSLGSCDQCLDTAETLSRPKSPVLSALTKPTLQTMELSRDFAWLGLKLNSSKIHPKFNSKGRDGLPRVLVIIQNWG